MPEVFELEERLTDWNESRFVLEDSRMDAERALQSAEDARSYIEADDAKYREQQAELKLKEPELKRAVQDAETAKNLAQTQVADAFATKNNIPRDDVGNFAPENIQKPAVAAAIGKVTADLTNKAREETVKAKRDPDKKEDVEKTLEEKWGGQHRGMKLLGVLALLGVFVELGLKDEAGHADWWSKHPDVSSYIPVGCVQYHLPSGSIKTLGVCGVQKTCTNLKTQTDCATQSAICSWDDTRSTCGPSDRIVNASSCCNSCSSSSECNTASTIKCQKDTDCLAGTCVNGYCTSQTCSTDTGTCTPCPSIDPADPILNQLMAGKLGFCQTGAGACSASTLICQTIANGGACEACPASDAFCANPGGSISSNNNCMCTGPNWVTTSVCATQTDLILGLMYMQATADQWQTPSTPWTVTVLQILGIVGLLATFFYFVRYLSRYGRAK